MSTKPVIERRQHSRAKRVLSVEYIPKQTAAKYPPVTHVSLTEDMSLGGLTLYCEQEYRVGDMLHVKVRMSGLLDIFDGPAKVVRVVKKSSAAIYFTAIKFLDATPKRPAKRHHLAPKKK